MRMIGLSIALAMAAACSESPGPAPRVATPAAPAVGEIPRAPNQPITKRLKPNETLRIDLDAVINRGFVRILVAPSRTFFETVNSSHRGRAVDIGVALAAELSRKHSREITALFIETPEDRLVPDLLVGKGDVAANVMLTFARDEQVAFAPPIKTGIRELVVTDSSPLVSLEDVGGRRIHVRKNSDHHASLIRLNQQLQKNNRRQAIIIVDDKTRTDEELLDSVNAGRIRATIVDDYIFDRWQGELLKIATTNREVAVSQDGVLAWVTRKDAPNLTAFMKEFFTTHKLSF